MLLCTGAIFERHYTIALYQSAIVGIWEEKRYRSTMAVNRWGELFLTKPRILKGYLIEFKTNARCRR